jgi:hypothetical protein
MSEMLDYVICHMTWDLSGGTLPKYPSMYMITQAALDPPPMAEGPMLNSPSVG